MGRGKSKKKTRKSGRKDAGTQRRASVEIPGSLLEAARGGDLDAVEAGIPGAAEAAALIDILSREQKPPVSMIGALAGRFPGREVDKALKRAVFALGKRGVPVGGIEQPDEAGAGKATVFTPVDRVEAHVGPYDVRWYRPVLVMIPRQGQGVDLALGIVSDEEGLGEFHFGARSRKEARGVRELISEKGGGLVPTSPAHAAALLEEAYLCHRSAGRPAPAGYLEARDRLRDAAMTGTDGETIGIRGNESPPPVTFDMAERLFSHPLMAPWRLPPPAVKAFSDAIAEVKSSPLILSEVQKRERILSLVEGQLKAVFSPEAVRRYIRRLEETAYLFGKRGEEDYRLLCSAAAAGLERVAGDFTKNPVLAVLIERSLAGDASPEAGSGAAAPGGEAGDRRLILM